MVTVTHEPRVPWSADDTFSDYARLRSEYGPISFDSSLDAWIVLGHDLARSVLADRRFSSDPMSSPQNRQALDELGITGPPLGQSMLLSDGDHHWRMRSSVRDVFMPRYVEQMKEGIDAICGDIVGTVGTDTQFDFMEHIAQPFPITVIAEWLGLDLATARTLWREAAKLAPALDGLLDQDFIGPVGAALASLIADFLPIADQRRTAPGDDLLSLLAADPSLALDEAVMNAILLAIAGHETTSNLLGGVIMRLWSGRAGTRLIDRIDIGERAVISELIRLDGPAQSVVRVATTPTRLGTHTVDAGDRVIVVIGAANRDPDVYDCPDEFRLDRSGQPQHLAFGHGVHRCIGAVLAQTELSVALRHLSARAPQVLDGARIRSSSVLRGWTTIPMVFTQDY